MAGYKLENTVTENGHVARGVCELDENGYVVRCEETEAESAAERPERPESGEEYTDDAYGLMLPPYDAPAPREDGKPWLYGMDFASEEYWQQLNDKLEISWTAASYANAWAHKNPERMSLYGVTEGVAFSDETYHVAQSEFVTQAQLAARSYNGSAGR